MGKGPTDEQIEAAADRLLSGEPLTSAEQRLLESPMGDFAMGQVQAYLNGGIDVSRKSRLRKRC